MTHNKSHLSWFVYGIISLCVALGGVTCYYAGYYSASKEFYAYYMAESLNDRLTASLYMLYGDTEASSSSDASELDDSSDALSSETSESETAEDTADEDMSRGEAHLASRDNSDVKVANISPLIESESLYDAYLIGFGSQRSAERYRENLKREGLVVRVETREHLTSRGKKIIWYQVVLGPLPYSKLLEVVKLLKDRDRLEGVVFVERKS